MILWHVTTYKKLKLYHNSGFIIPPVRSWKNIEDAVNFSKQTGRGIIIRLKSDSSFKRDTNYNKEVYTSNTPYSVSNI
jgi:hypothetical protein